MSDLWWDRIAIDVASARYDRAALSLRCLMAVNAVGMTTAQSEQWDREFRSAQREMFDAYTALCRAKSPD